MIININDYRAAKAIAAMSGTYSCDCGGTSTDIDISGNNGELYIEVGMDAGDGITVYHDYTFDRENTTKLLTHILQENEDPINGITDLIAVTDDLADELPGYCRKYGIKLTKGAYCAM